MRVAEETVQSGLAAKREWPTHGYFMGWCQDWYAGCSEWQLPACLPPSQRPCSRLLCTTRLPLRTCQLPLAMPHDCCIYLLESAGWMATHSATRLLASQFWQYAQIITPRGRVLDADLLRRAERLLGAGRSCLPHLKRWLPRLQMQAYEQYQERFEHYLAEVQRGTCVGREGRRSNARISC